MWKVALAKQAARPLVIIGTGNVGSGFCVNNDFERKGYKVVAAFDNDPQKCGRSLGTIPKVQHTDHMKQVVKDVGAQVAILDGSGADVHAMTRLMVDAGISTILNYSSENLRVPKHVNVLDMSGGANKNACASPFMFLGPLSGNPTPLLIPLARYKFGIYNPDDKIVLPQNISSAPSVQTDQSLSINKCIPSNSDVHSRYNSDFVELELLGKGGFGSVYRVYNRIDECEYAVKKISLKVNDQNLREVRAMAKLSHPNIVRYYASWLESSSKNETKNNDTDNNPYFNDEISSEENNSFSYSSSSSDYIGSENTCSSQSEVSSLAYFSQVGTKHSEHTKATLYIQMELCSKLTLRDWMANPERNIDLPQCIDLITQLLHGLKYIHSKGYIHRDITPANLFLAASDECNSGLQLKIGDMGLTIQSDSIIESQENVLSSVEISSDHTLGVGTYLYASPEQLKSTNYNSNADMYSVGVIFFEMLQSFKTQVERIMTLTKLKAGLIETSFSILYSRESGLIQWLLCNDAAQRPTASQLLHQLSTN